ncbi:putative uncharacterized protein [Parachlamydia acanthamoebae UV-7]|jgi:hypothetical protein|uniref:Uncharacterized protein n=2 Tax=Parachlamydia acanthamoebae TaxID=83552 RepID=F8KZJ0_PARAV|nr:hypothetical protein [Parachlamydia acanthamoebae]EFB41783.1 hypothetical protein pah_c022o062 [Parachlamydia acanthamoebae str. Hall's coccus]KIA77938.1 hypothetical protein DB43_FI00010 [Parachlamydia acanthamoebae]CCB86330.1 putative uncharacterized protein [Parachlamydia acanthamoebae UV-7]
MIEPYITILNDRAYRNIVGNKSHFLHENKDLHRALLKGSSFKIYRGMIAKLLSLLGFATKLEYRGCEAGKKNVYVNNKSLANYLVRYVLAIQSPCDTAEIAHRQNNLYSNPTEEIQKIQMFAQKKWDEFKKTTRTRDFEFLTVELELNIESELERSK